MRAARIANEISLYVNTLPRLFTIFVHHFMRLTTRVSFPYFLLETLFWRTSLTEKYYTSEFFNSNGIFGKFVTTVDYFYIYG